MTMNGNLSQQQMKSVPSVNKLGAMPLKPKYDGPAPIATPKTEGVLQPGKNILIPKPGFF
jgi:hypothetical protein